MKPLNLYGTLVAKADRQMREAADGAYFSIVAVHDNRVVDRQDYGPVYAAEMIANGEKLARLMERCHDFFCRCTKYHGPTGRPAWILEARGLWGPTSVRRWADIPCRACEIEAHDNHDPGDEDKQR